MHPNDAQLRSLIDREIPDTLARQVREHLSRCPACQGRLAAMERHAERAQARLERLAPGPGEQPRSARQAYARFARHERTHSKPKETFQTMFTKPSNRPVWTALVIIAVLALSLSLTPVRAWASSFLSLFRVQQITVVQFDMSSTEGAQQALDANREKIEQIFKNDLKIEEKGKAQPAASADEAAAAAGFRPRLPTLKGGARLMVQPGFQAEFTIDQPKLQELMDLIGMDVQLPASLNGQVVTADVPNAVTAIYNCPEGMPEPQAERTCTVLLQVPSPVVNAPEGLDVPQLGQAMLQFLGMPEAEARELSQRIDWATTLVVPLPQGDRFAHQDVQVDGVTGTLLKSSDPDDPGYMLLWVKDGVIYSLRGPSQISEGLSIANSLK